MRDSSASVAIRVQPSDLAGGSTTTVGAGRGSVLTGSRFAHPAVTAASQLKQAMRLQAIFKVRTAAFQGDGAHKWQATAWRIQPTASSSSAFTCRLAQLGARRMNAGLTTASEHREVRRGFGFGVAAYGLWGILPIYFKADRRHFGVRHRRSSSVVVAAVPCLAGSRLPAAGGEVRQALRRGRTLVLLLSPRR